jgi:hypothetical protein
MQLVRVYTGSDGESHFEDVTPEQFAQIVNNVGEGPITCNCRPSPSCYVNLQEKKKTLPLSGTSHRLLYFPLCTEPSMQTSHL